MYCVNAYQAPVVWNKLYHASLVKRCPFPLIAYEDEAWLPYILSFADRVCYLNEGLYEYDDTHKNSLSDKCHQKTGDEIFLNHKRAVLFYLENGNPVRWEMLKEVARKELSLFARIYKNVEYENLWKQITENEKAYMGSENRL
ncbi:MAG: hypothetical protein K2P71_02565 [Lachnospiraceae bacterium]|nr:hypothetical protein [Lachnospiraceae bacterium]